MKNLRRLALVSSIAALGAVAFNPKAQAETADVTFSGNIPFACSFSSTTGGTLAANAYKAGWVEAAGGSVSGLDIGNSGLTTLSCNGAATVSPSSPVKESAPDAFDDSNKQSIIYSEDSGEVASSSTGTAPWTYPGFDNPSISIPANTSRTLKVAMTVGKDNGTVLAGSYIYKVTVTATAN